MPKRQTIARFQGHGTLSIGERHFVASYRIHLWRDTPGLYDTRNSLVAVHLEAFADPATKALLRLDDGRELAITIRDGLMPNKRVEFWVDDASVLVTDG